MSGSIMGALPSLCSHRRHCAPSDPRCEYYGVVGSDVSLRNLPVDALPPRPSDCLRFVVISDTHERHREVSVPPGDVLVHCGDILFCDSLNSRGHSQGVLSDFFAWLNAQPHPLKIFIAGNHDSIVERLGASAVRRMAAPAVYLCDDSVVVEPGALRVYGSPRSIANSRLSPNKAFQSSSAWAPIKFDLRKNAKSDEKEPLSVWDAPLSTRMESAVHGPIDVLVTHQCLTRKRRGNGHAFDKRMRRFLLEGARAPRVHLCGHVHEHHGIHILRSKEANVPSINASSLRAFKGEIQCPCVVDVQVPKRA